MTHRIRQEKTGPGALDLIEEAVHLLRTAPTSLLAAYYLGSLPFILGLLYFWAEMSTSGLAPRYSSPAALGLALLFIWMKSWQSIFAAGLMARTLGQTPPSFGLGRVFRLTASQAIIQSSGLFLLPLALVLVWPLPWVYAFYQNVTVLGHGQEAGLRSIIKDAWSQARLWPITNSKMLAILGLFGVFVFLNLALTVYMGPQLLKTFLGLETLATMSGLAFFNSTFLTATIGLTYLCMDPLIKTVYTLRCFYGQARRSGQDLLIELTLVKQAARGLGLVLMIVGLASSTGSAWADPGPPERKISPPTSSAQAISRPVVSAEDLSRALTEVLSRREFTWRLPRTEKSNHDNEPGLLGGFLEWSAKKIKAGVKALVRWIKKMWRWLDRLWPKSKKIPTTESAALEPLTSADIMLLAASVLTAALLILAAWRTISRRRSGQIIAATPAPTPLPDLTDENVEADQLPSQDWLTQAKEIMARGETRLALRAFYLSILARLAEVRVIVLAKYKTNRDYQRELGPRANQEVSSFFSSVVNAFELAWYGGRAVKVEDLTRFMAEGEKVVSELT